MPAYNDSHDDSSSATTTTSSSRSPHGLWLLVTAATAVAGVYAIAVPFITPAMRGKLALPFVPASPRQIELVLQQCRQRGGPLVDLGSGDGRVVLAAAREGIPAVGYELNLWLVLWARVRARLMGVSRLAKFYRRDLWKLNMSQPHFHNISVFGVAEMMPTLEAKLVREMRDDAVLIACRFKLPTWHHETEIVDPRGDKGLNSVWVYRRPPPRSGETSQSAVNV